jgi:hypothetical protein
MVGLSFFLWFWWAEAGEPEQISNISFYLLIAVAALLSFIFGVLVTTIFFLSKRAADKPNLTVAQSSPEIESPRTPIKQCPKCNSTYTDEDLTYCLRDGLALKIVGSMPVPSDPEETKVFKR